MGQKQLFSKLNTQNYLDKPPIRGYVHSVPQRRAQKKLPPHNGRQLFDDTPLQADHGIPHQAVVSSSAGCTAPVILEMRSLMNAPSLVRISLILSSSSAMICASFLSLSIYIVALKQKKSIGFLKIHIILTKIRWFFHKWFCGFFTPENDGRY